MITGIIYGTGCMLHKRKVLSPLFDLLVGAHVNNMKLVFLPIPLLQSVSDLAFGPATAHHQPFRD